MSREIQIEATSGTPLSLEAPISPSQSFLSEEADAIMVPDGCIAVSLTEPVWPPNRCFSTPDSTSHMLVVRSALPAEIYCISGLHAHRSKFRSTLWVAPSKIFSSLVGFCEKGCTSHTRTVLSMALERSFEPQGERARPVIVSI